MEGGTGCCDWIRNEVDKCQWLKCSPSTGSNQKNIHLDMQITFPLTRIYSDENGDSRFEEISLPLNDAGEIGRLSERYPASSVIFREVKSDYNYDFHNAPQKQYLVLIDGAIEIETSLGEKRQFQPGDVLLLEDTDGKGHRTKNLKQAVRRSIFITIP